MTATPLVLASGSRYRRALLDRLQLPYTVDPADIDETAADGESAVALALRLACDKARHVATRHPNTWVLGSDQVAALGDRQLGKPGTRERATVSPANTFCPSASSIDVCTCIPLPA